MKAHTGDRKRFFEALATMTKRPDPLPWFGGSSRVHALILLTLILIAYLPALGAGTIWDDDAHVTQNIALHSIDGLRLIWLKVGAVQQYYPATYTAFWLQYHSWGTNPVGYHAVNVLLHAANAILLFFVLRKLSVPTPWAVAATFGLHPVQVESVAWISELKNCLSSFFYLSAMLMLICAWGLESTCKSEGHEDSGVAHTKPFFGFYICAFGLFLFALLSKSVTASLPAAFLLIVWWKRERINRRDILFLVPFFTAGVVAGLFTAWVEKHFIGAQGVDWALSPLQRCLLAGRAIFFYIEKLLWPFPLVFNYPRWTIDTGARWLYWFPFTFLGVVAVLWRLRTRIGRGPLVGILFFAGTLFPALGFFDVYPMRYSFVADHFQYLASAGFLATFVGSVSACRGAVGKIGQSTWMGVLFLILAVLGILTWQQSRIYRDEETLYRDILAKNPESFLAHYNLGRLLDARGRWSAAAQHYEQALRVKPDLAEAHNNLGIILLREGLTDNALTHFAEARRLLPLDPLPSRNFADALMRKDHAREALAIYERLLRDQPRDPVLQRKIGTALAALGRPEEAKAHLEKALETIPGYAEAHLALADVLLSTRQIEAAAFHYREVLRLKGLSRPEAIGRAWSLATGRDGVMRDGAEALTLAKAAAGASSEKDARVLDTLAAAYAESRRFNEAIRLAKLAVARAHVENEPVLARAIERRLKLYEQGEPYRERNRTALTSF
jgi:tetratricopeptide (TPR) repeat protein